MFAILVKVRVKPNQRERFLAAIEDDAICSERDEPGCVRFNVLRDEADPDVYFLYEVYRDESAFEAHQRTPHFARWSAVAGTVLDGPGVLTRTATLFPRDPAYWG